MTTAIHESRYGALPDGREVTEYTLDNGRGLHLSAINLGGIVTSLEAPDRHGCSANIVLNQASLADYLESTAHLGTIVGRYANRIARGRFVIDGVTHQATVNDGAHSLHGGTQGFGARFWDAAPGRDGDSGDVCLALRYTSAHGEEGHPGEMHCTVRYTLRADTNEWQIDYHAVTDRPTVVNLSHHDYFNLAGKGSILDHHLTIPASSYLPVDASLIPVGMENVDGTPFDFRAATTIGARIRETHPQLLHARGYDHNWLLDRDGDGLALAARLAHGASGRVLEVFTSEPGVQFYSGNFLDGRLTGRDGIAWRQSDGLCLETQHYPDSPNRPEFPATMLRPGDTFSSTTVHRFSVLQAGADAEGFGASTRR